MKRRLAKLVLMGCSIATVALAVMWARSGYRGDCWIWGDESRRWVVRSDWGRIVVTRIIAPGPRQRFSWQTASGGYYGMGYGLVRSRNRVPGAVEVVSGSYTDFRMNMPARGPSETYVRVTMFYWVPVAFTFLSPFVWAFRRARRAFQLASRVRHGLCVTCGYDLRGSGGAGRCPECGRDMIATAAAPDVARTQFT
jgi:hypothetical protein